MQTARRMLIIIWQWIGSNVDALIVETISIAVTLGLIEALLRRRERRRWSPTRRQVAAEVGNLFFDVFWTIAKLSGIPWDQAIIPSPSDKELLEMLRDGTWDPDRYNLTHVARFFDNEYPRGFYAKHEKALQHASDDDLKTLSEMIGSVLTHLEPSIDLAKSVFGPEVTAALLRVKEQGLWAQDVLHAESVRGAGREERGSMTYVLELTQRMAGALILLWENVS